MSLLIEALKQAEARKGPKATTDKTAEQKQAESASEAGKTSKAEASQASSDATPGPQQSVAAKSELSLEPQEQAPEPAPNRIQQAESEAALAEPADKPLPAPPVSESAATPASAPAPAPTPAPTSSSHASSVGAKPTPAAAEPRGDATAGPTSAAKSKEAGKPAAPMRMEPHLGPGAETDNRRTAQAVIGASAKPGARPRRSPWLLASLGMAVVALLGAAAWWWSGLGNQPSSMVLLPADSVPTVPASTQPEADPNEMLSEESAAAADIDDDAAAEISASTLTAMSAPNASSESALATDASVAEPLPSTSAPALASSDQSESAAAPAARREEPAIRLDRSEQPPMVSRATETGTPLQDGYAALNAGDLTAAASAYRNALRRFPRHPDALLGLAVIAERSGNRAEALQRYREVLRSDARNPTALAAILSLSMPGDVNAESQLREALTRQPRAASLHFALGNQLAQAARWSEAQGAYFDAFSLDSSNPDYAFNLAIALDRLYKPRLALDYYRSAMELSVSRPAAFDRRAVQQRIATIEASIR